MSLNESFLIDKKAMKRSFEKAAQTYDSANFLHKEIADRLLSRMDYVKIRPEKIIDLGCRTGYASNQLAGHYKNSSIIAIDIAHAMTVKTRGERVWWKRHLPILDNNPVRVVCADIEQLPIADNSIDLAWSNLTLHWYDLNKSIASIHRALKVEGLFTFTTLGPDTLKELRQAFGDDDYVHVNQFVDMHDIGDTLVHAGFADPVMDMEILTITFDSLSTIVSDLKALGVNNKLNGRSRGLFSSAKWKRVEENYESCRKDGKLPVTIEVIYGHAWKPKPKKLNDGRQVIEFRNLSK